MLEIEFGKRLHASEQASIQRVALYLADTNKHREPVPNLDYWVEGAVHLLTDINFGCTRLPAAYGSWRSESGTTFEHAIVIYSYIRNPTRFEQRLNEIVAFVHRYGKEAEQEAVMVELSGGAYGNYFSRAYFVSEADFVDFSPQQEGAA